MAELTGYERVMRTFKREPVDTMPFFSGYGMVLLPAIKKLGYKFPQMTSAEKIAKAGVESARMFNMDAVAVPYDMCAESEALGNKISLYEDSDEILYPTIPNRRNWENLDQVNLTQEDIDVGTTLEEAELILHKHRVEKLLVVNDQYELKGLITVKDIQKKLKYPNASKDDQGRLRVGGAIGATGDFLERAAELVRARADVLAIDSAHGHSSRVLEAVRDVKKRFPTSICWPATSPPTRARWR